VQQFTLALTLAPDHEEAARGLARAEVREAVLERMAAGRLAEASAQPDAAVQAYRAAAELDPEFAPAAAATERVAAAQAERAFATAMSRALEALEGGRFGAAAQALEQAATLRPGDRAVADARQRLATARRAAELERLRREADRLAAAEAWGAAAARYDAALQLDPAAGFARNGSAHASQRARLHARLDLYLEEPQRLFSPEPLGEAERLLAEVRPLPTDQPRLAAKVERLAGLVAAATTPRQVTLRSDGQTEVTVHHVGGLGRFGERQLALRPGSYTAVGARPGYRDVRVTFTVAVDGPPPVVDVRCREPL
jgi:tetratricopeptide (TPR) repeat protein